MSRAFKCIVVMGDHGPLIDEQVAKLLRYPGVSTSLMLENRRVDELPFADLAKTRPYVEFGPSLTNVFSRVKKGLSDWKQKPLEQFIHNLAYHHYAFKEGHGPANYFRTKYMVDAFDNAEFSEADLVIVANPELGRRVTLAWCVNMVPGALVYLVTEQDIGGTSESKLAKRFKSAIFNGSTFLVESDLVRATLMELGAEGDRIFPLKWDDKKSFFDWIGIDEDAFTEDETVESSDEFDDAVSSAE